MSISPPIGEKEGLERARQAQKVLQSQIRYTELCRSRSFSKRAGSEIFLKYENRQYTGSFKIRGAMNKLASLTPEEKKKGVVASSAGNHSQGVAYSARALDVKAHIVMPETAPLIKVHATKAYGAEVIQHGEIYDDAFEKAQELAKEKGLVFVSPYEDDAVIAGQATIGLEIVEQLEDVDTIITSIGGGGLISGIAMAAKALNPKIKVFGVQAERVCGYQKMFKNEALQEKFLPTIADGIAVKKPSRNMFDKYISKYVDDVSTVSEEEISEAMVLLLERRKAVVEGSGAAALAGAFSGRLKLGQKTAVVLSGGNVDLNTISKIIQQGLIVNGRLAQVSVVVDDSPGTLGKISEVMGRLKANILEVNHHRHARGLVLRQTRINFLLETVDEAHIEKIRKALEEIDVRVIDS